ncbi:MAG: tyrosine-type recombinase/integrase [Thermales bacterium]|nr:tyrosine-type recombinase/integrase [Thermales bacterium]
MSVETIKYLTPNEISKFISKIDSLRDKTLFSLMYFYGLRCTEASDLNLDDIRLSDGRIYIRAAKNGISGEYVLTKEVKKILQKYLPERNSIEKLSKTLFISRKGGKLSTTQIRRLYYKYATKAKLGEEKSHPHCLRHSIAVHMADSGVPVEHVQIHLRHRKIDSTMVYFQITSKRRHEIQTQALGGEFVAKNLPI